MYCSSCRQERLGGQFCAACGKPMTSRSREALQQELAHVRFLLEELPHWDASSVPKGARNYLTQRYERQVRILLGVIPDAAAAESPAPVAAPEVVAPAPTVEPAGVAEPPAAQAVSEPVPSEPRGGGWDAAPAPSPERFSSEESTREETHEAEQEDAQQDETPLPLPPLVTEPLFDAPAPRTATARLVEEVSTWDTLWKPFLYESIGWFIGAFLIVAGSLYLAFDSWAGLTSFSRSLVVFGMTAGYSAAFSICGSLLARREALVGAGRILGLIGAAVAPFAGIALGPVARLELEGIPLALLLPLLLGWSVGAAVLARKPAESFDAPSRPFVQLALMGTTFMMGCAPLFAHLGDAAFWLDVLPCVLFFALARQRIPEPRSGPAIAFALAAPLYLLALYFVRLHLALRFVGIPPALGSYAPLLALLLVAALRLRPFPPEKAADALTVGAVALQAGCLALAATGKPPAFFLTTAIFTWNVLGLGRGEGLRVRWLYAAYAGAYLSYTSSSQLIPGMVKALIEALKARLGYAASGKLPFNYGATSAVPFVLAGVLLAAWLQARARRTSSALDEARTEVLLRSTAVASLVFVLLGHAGPDQRPAFWTTLGLMTLCVVNGLRFERPYLSIVGSALTFFLTLSAGLLFGAGTVSLLCGAVALGFAGLARGRTGPTLAAFSAAAGWLSLAGFTSSLSAGNSVAALGGMALAGAAALLVAWNLAHPVLFAIATATATALVPRLADFVDPSWVPLALAVSGLGLAFLGGRGGLVRHVGLAGVAYALLAFVWGSSLLIPWLGVIVLLAAAAVAVASRVTPEVGPIAVVLAGIALLPRVAAFSVWPWMTPSLSMALLVLWSLGASVAAARWGRNSNTLTAGLVALVFPMLVVLSAAGRQSYALMLGAALAALLTARVLHPTVSLLAASFWAGLSLGIHLDAPRTLAMATLFSGLALLESHPRTFRVLTGERRFALVASLCAMPFLLAACGVSKGLATPVVLVGAMVLPLAWTRANRQPFFASLAPLYVLVLGIESTRLRPGIYLLPLVALAVVRAVEHKQAIRRLVLGGDEEPPVREFSWWMQFALGGVGVAMTVGGSPEWSFVPLVASLVLLPGPMPSVRVGVGVAVLAAHLSLHPGAILLLLGLGFLTHHVPARLWSLFRSPPDPRLRLVTVMGALGLAVWTNVARTPTPGSLLLLAGVLGVSAFLLSRAYLLTASLLTLASASLGQTPEHGFLVWTTEAALAFAGVGLGAAVLSALCQVGRLQRSLSRWSERLSPGLPGTWSEPLWAAGSLATLVPLSQHLLDEGPGALPLPVAALAGLAALVLMVTRERVMANLATALLAGVILAAVPPLWSPAVVAVTGLVLCLVGTWVEGRGADVGAALHHSGWVLSLLSFLGLRSLTHPGIAVCLVASLGVAWTVVYRRREREAMGWWASLLVAHGLLVHVGAIYSTGRGAAFLLPYFGAISALLATLVLSVAGASVRRRVGHAFAGVALAEVLAGLVLVPGAAGVVREALVDCVCLTVLFFALVRRGVRERDEGSAFLAQGTLVLGYLAVRLHALASGLGTADSLAALVGGVLFSGLHVFVQREGAGLPAFRRPALWGAYLFPLAGLLAAPWSKPLAVAALLVGYAAHFAALAAQPSQRGMGSLVSAGAFNTALFFVWLGTGSGEPQYYVIPAGLSLLVLLRVFHDALEPDTRVKLRALAVTLVYVAGAWKPLLFQDGRAMLGCVALCVVGVAAGMALRIRSYVYLGSAFMVTCVVANLARFGIQEHRLGAAFLSLLGVGVVGFMVLFTAKRAELLERYERVRAMMATWEG
ncbi:hypothetical protein CYFUS_004698 [Cystobacter fuscus]|uniref:Uncharacterized protein n=2 Tax=Cystobacter fuscus TaxID=43 RepID=A0A250J5P9_9BACT|nr:hypothetical protein CYFUS_004698 [Cystobacter fuscus]